MPRLEEEMLGIALLHPGPESPGTYGNDFHTFHPHALGHEPSPEGARQIQAIKTPGVLGIGHLGTKESGLAYPLFSCRERWNSPAQNR